MKALILALLGITAAARMAAMERLLSPEQALRLAFPSATHFQQSVRALSAAQVDGLKQARHRHPLNATVQWARAFNAQGAWLGSAMLDAELGKHQPMDYLVALDPAGKVLDVELLTYREAYGGGVRSERFRAQFKGKDKGAALTLGHDLDAVSGATISSRTLADGVAKALRLFQDFETPKTKEKP